MGAIMRLLYAFLISRALTLFVRVMLYWGRSLREPVRSRLQVFLLLAASDYPTLLPTALSRRPMSDFDVEFRDGHVTVRCATRAGFMALLEVQRELRSWESENRGLAFTLADTADWDIRLAGFRDTTDLAHD